MNRSKLLVGIGSAVVGASVLVGSAVYTSEAQRDTGGSEPAATGGSLDPTDDTTPAIENRHRRDRTRDVTRHLDPIFRTP